MRQNNSYNLKFPGCILRALVHLQPTFIAHLSLFVCLNARLIRLKGGQN